MRFHPPRAGVWRDELIETIKLAGPLALTQLGQIAMMTTDLALIGRLGDEAVAAAALAHTVFFVCFTFGMGLMSAVAPLAAQAFGARNPRRVRRSLRVGLWAGLLISLPMMAFPLYGEQILVLLGQAPATAHLAQQYLFGLAWGGFTYTTREKVVDIGPIHASRDETHHVPLPPIAGAVALVGGIVLMVAGKKD